MTSLNSAYNDLRKIQNGRESLQERINRLDEVARDAYRKLAKIQGAPPPDEDWLKAQTWKSYNEDFEEALREIYGDV